MLLTVQTLELYNLKNKSFMLTKVCLQTKSICVSSFK